MNNIIGLGLWFLIIGLAVYVAMIFNGLIGLKNDVARAWANIDILLKQRHDELPRLVEVCKGYMNYECDALEKITQARGLYRQTGSVIDKAEADKNTTAALNGLFAVAEKYPDLKANQNFLELQKRITDLENGIADRREYYNDSVNTLNIRMQQFPDTFIASFMSLRPVSMFKVEETDKSGLPMSFGAAG
jgi:LemA protein